MIDCKIAQVQHIQILKELYSKCFCASSFMTDLFFGNKFRLENCVVCTKNNEVVAALHMFNAFICKNSTKYPVTYIYAAATFSEHRGQGYMKNLLNFSNYIASARGSLYLFLLPATKKLYDFYSKLGYQTFFKRRIVNIEHSNLNKFLTTDLDTVKNELCCSFEKIRAKIFSSNGDIFWNNDHICYAILDNSYNNGCTFYTKNGYAICRLGEDVVDIIEIAATEQEFKNLLSQISCKFRAKSYNLALNVASKMFKNLGKIENYGMIKPINGKDQLELLKLKGAPYFGLALE